MLDVPVVQTQIFIKLVNMALFNGPIILLNTSPYRITNQLFLHNIMHDTYKKLKYIFLNNQPIILFEMNVPPFVFCPSSNILFLKQLRFKSIIMDI